MASYQFNPINRSGTAIFTTGLTTGTLLATTRISS
jgi:hypothetical protein